MLTLQPLPIALSIALLAMFSTSPDPTVASSIAPPAAALGGANCQVQGPNPVCVGVQNTYTSLEAGSNFAWSFTFNAAGASFCGPTNQQSVCIVTTQPGLFRVQVNYTNATGAHSCAVEPTSIAGLVIAGLQDVSTCAGDDVLFSTSVISGGAATFAWTFNDGTGAVTIPGATGSSLSLLDVGAGVVGVYCVTATGTCVSESCCATLSLEGGAAPVLGVMGSQTVCEGDDVTFTANVISGSGLSFQWSKNTGGGLVQIPGATNSTLVLNDVTEADQGVYCVVASNKCGSDEACTELVVDECGGEEFCTLTQGAYGTAGGAGNLAQINGLLSTDLVVGKAGRSLRILAGGGQCVIDRLAAGGPAAALPATLGDATLSSTTCQTSPVALPLQNNGTFRNVFLGQVITLSLNTRLDVNLSALGICESMTSDQDLKTLGDEITRTISLDVFTALSAAGLPHTVGGLLELANRALAGQATGVASISEINDAVSGINELFDECRTLVECE